LSRLGSGERNSPEANLLFQPGKAGQAREQMSLDEEGRFRMASRCHAEIVSIRSAKKSLCHPLQGGNNFLGDYPV
jgi:hypothetical protein